METKSEKIEVTIGTYRATVNVPPPVHVVRAWRTRLFKGATFATIVDGHRASTDLETLALLYLPPAKEKALPRPPVDVKGPIEVPEGASPKDIRDAFRRARFDGAPIHTLRKAPPVRASKRPANDAAPASEAPQSAPPPAPEAPQAAPARAVEIYTLGYDGGLSPAAVDKIVTSRAIDLVVDMRSKPNSHTFSVAALRALWGAKYTSVRDLKGAFGRAVKEDSASTFLDALAGAAAKGNPRVLLLRKEEAPGDSWSAMQTNRLIVLAGLTCTHLYQHEEVTAAELQKAIDLDVTVGGDHYYECTVEIDERADERAKILDKIAKLDRLAARNPNANEAASARAAADALRAEWGIPAAKVAA